MKKAKIYYFTLTDEMRKEEKLDWFRSHSIEQLEFEHIQPDKNSNWINLADTDFDSLLPLVDKEVKQGRGEVALFKLYTQAVNTARDEWVYDFNNLSLEKKMIFLIDIYNKDLKKFKDKSREEIANSIDYSIKWTRAVKNDLAKGKIYQFNSNNIVTCFYRPFIKKYLYYSKELNEMLYQLPMVFPKKKENLVIAFIGINAPRSFTILGFNQILDLNALSPACGGVQCLPVYRYDKSGNRIDNITDWGLEQFRNHYHLSEPGFSGLKDSQDLTEGKKRKKSGKSVKQKNAEGEISREDIFHYVYAVLHNPAYREKYELNLKREFPRIPFYPDFWKWAKWGKALMDLHINYETAKPFDLKEHHAETKAESMRQKKAETAKEPEAVYAPKLKIKPRLKADKEKGIIEINELSFLSGVPKEAWEYKLGNRSTLEWIIDQYKEKKPKDPTIAEKFNTYRFADYKEHVIDLLKRVCTVSVETINIIDEMKKWQS